ncbi:hypothetical protein BGZ54_009652 [Gamsiella multidivaricata]|nr:hypothetical protein BGZ54_009652 [Gamsiella multidivaricata]
MTSTDSSPVDLAPATTPAATTKKKPRCWGSFEYEEDGRKHIVQFTKEGNDGESGVGGYVFGRRHDCDFILPSSPLVSGRHFLIYKEMVHDPDLKKAVERIFLKDFSSNGTFINNVKVGVNRRVQLKDHDKINYLHEARKSRDRCRFIFREGEPADDLTFDSQYERGPQLGAGNFATVFRTTHRKTGVVYAAKVVRKNESFTAKVEASLEREIGILMSIDQAGLIGVADRAPDGELFDQIIDKQKFTEKETRHIFKQVLEGVKYLHDRGVVHRDLKPENILVMDKDTMTVKISDFGLAKMIGERVFFNTICGTPSYVAPEVIRNGEYGKGVDMWSLGVVLYICLCGFPPFSDDLAPPKLRIQVLQSMYTFPSPYWDEISDEAVDLVQVLLAQNPEDRLTVDEALDHVWMTLDDDEGTMPSQSRTDPMPKVKGLLSRVMTERADRAIQRGVRVGYSQPTPFSQTIPDLPEDNDEDEEPQSQVVDSQEYSQLVERGDTVEMGYGSGIGIFSQDGMVRGTGMDTDSEDNEDDGTFYHSLKEGNPSSGKPAVAEDTSDVSNDAVAGAESDRSFMSVQETFNSEGSAKISSANSFQGDKTMREPSMNGGMDDEAAISTVITTTSKEPRPESGSDTDERSSKRARTGQ